MNKKTVAKAVRRAAAGKPTALDSGGSASLSAWLYGHDNTWDSVYLFIPFEVADMECAFLSPLPDDDARRTFLLLVAEALEST